MDIFYAAERSGALYQFTQCLYNTVLYHIILYNSLLVLNMTHAITLYGAVHMCSTANESEITELMGTEQGPLVTWERICSYYLFGPPS